MNLTEMKTNLKNEFIKQASRADTALNIEECEHYKVIIRYGDEESVTIKREEDGLELEFEFDLDTISRCKRHGLWELRDKNGYPFVIQFMGLEPLHAAGRGPASSQN